MSKAPPPSLSPLPTELLKQLGSLSPLQLAWLSGYCWSRCEQADTAQWLAGATSSAQQGPDNTITEQTVAPRRVLILSASQTGNARRVAEQLHQKLGEHGVDARLEGAGNFKSKTLPDQDIVLLVSSTQGEGEPPEEAVPLYKFLFGKKVPDLGQLSFAVLGLGDSSYPDFCQAGKDFDAQLAKLGATRLADRGDCDLDYQAAAEAWIEHTVSAVVARVNTGSAASSDSTGLAGGFQPGATADNRLDAPAHTDSHLPGLSAARQYSREHPFTASLSVRQKITARGAEKDVEHVEIDLAGSDIQYQVGDALGIWPVNAAPLVDEILGQHGLSGDENVQLPDGHTLSLRDALTEHLDITQNTPAFVQQYAALAEHEDLKRLVEKPEALDAYLAMTPPVGVFRDYPHPLPAQILAGLFRPLTPRLYSIASAQDEVGDEVHLTVGVVQYTHQGNTYTGAASGFLARQLEEGDPLRVFVEPNPHFRLPADGDTPIIMIGAGTGIAPFRAFMQQREANGDSGRNWLIFGNQRFIDDFLYQAEWLQYRKNGLLTRGDFAWSRQGAEKVYVQHKLLEAGAEVWAWLQAGAHLYVCGDANRMARDVEQALLQIIQHHGQKDPDDADDYLNELREDKRYQRDVY
ncbi:MAG: assimilatory sulfite reductase (NADPH) flavoprotein subunit [Lautropia sp.]|nr:assimilatory sulfite reductase (NADPH) flavoprotein subunit [Lautropia sp.]